MTSYFSLDEQLDSYNVSKELILSLEEHLRKIFSRYFTEADISDDRKPIWIRLQDSVGTEFLESISAYSPHRFPDDVNSLRVELNAQSRKGPTSIIEVKITFNESKPLSTLHVTCAGNNAREIAIGIRDGVKQCLSAGKTNHSTYHLPEPWKTTVNTGLWLSGFAILVALQDHFSLTAQILIPIFTLLFFFIFSAKTTSIYSFRFSKDR